MKNLEANSHDYNNTFHNTSMHNHKTINIDEIIEEKKKHLEQEIRKTIEAEFLSAQSELKQKHEEGFQELNKEYSYMEEILNNDKAILKQNLNKYIEENIANKLKIDDILQDLKIKDEEIAHLKKVIELYKKSQQEQIDELTTSINLSTKETEVNGNFTLFEYFNLLLKQNKLESQDDKSQFENSLDRFNELENENINLIKEIFKLKKEFANLSLEKSFIEFRFKDQEKINKLNYENLLNINHNFEKTLSESKREIETLIKKNNNYEKELYKMEEISKLNENFKLNIVSLENQINNSKKTNQANLILIKDFKEQIDLKNEQIKDIENEMIEKMNYSSNKLLQYEKDIKNLNAIKNELENKLENSLAMQERVKKHEKEIYDLNYKIFNYESELKNKLEENERVRLFMKESITAYFKNELKDKKQNDIVDIFNNINDYNKNIDLNFDQLVCLVFKK